MTHGHPFSVHRFPTLESSNLQARELARGGAPEGTVVVATTQTAGRGSGKREWASPPGGLYLTLLLRGRADRRPTDLSLLAGAAMVRAVKRLLPAQRASVKWPNDCLLNGKKVGGILSENLGEEASGLCAVGIGLNVNTPSEALAAFRGNPFSATSIKEAAGEQSLDAVLEALLQEIHSLYLIYKESGFGEIRQNWEQCCEFIGKRVDFVESGWREASPGPTLTGILEGIDDQGGLVLTHPLGDRRTFFTGEITKCY